VLVDFSNLNVVPYRQHIEWVNPTAYYMNGEPFDMGAHGSYELSFGALSTTYHIAAPVFDKSIVDYFVYLITNSFKPKPPMPNPPTPSGPIPNVDPAFDNKINITQPEP
jgi:hypothetical protein